MTAQEMQYNFELKLGTFHSLDKPFTSTDIAVFLNKAQDEVVKMKYSDRFGRSSERFERDEKLRLELGALVSNFSATAGQFDSSNVALHANALFVSLPSDYLYSLKEMCVVTYPNCNAVDTTGTARVLPIRLDEYEMNIKNPYGKPYRELVWRMDYGSTGAKRHELVHAEDNTITKYNLRYLKSPISINIIDGVDCQLHVSLHDEIVDRAIQIAIGSIPKLNNVTQN